MKKNQNQKRPNPPHNNSQKKSSTTISGVIKRHADGFGFLIPDDVEHADVYIPKQFMVGVMGNDKVSAEVIKRHGEARFHGEITEILSRGTKHVVGQIHDLNSDWKIIPDESKAWGGDLKIKIEDCGNAKDGELVHVEILHYPNQGTPFSGKVIEVIGNAEDPLNDVKRVLRTLNVPTEFNRATISEAAILKDDPDPADYKDRKDLRNLTLITIDGATAKDFDDAVFTRVKSTGFQLFVAIADVSHYVRRHTSIDKDAYERGTSVYFPNYVVPMIPEKISNGLCSLKPHVPRLCVVAEMHFDFQGQMIESHFYEAVMESKARVTYGEAQEVIDGTEVPSLVHVKENILKCADLAKILMAKRFKEGSLDLNISETELEIDASGNPVDVQKSERLFAHRLIEELMLAANVAVAQFLGSKEIPSIYRIHDDPSPDSIKLLEVYLFNLGAKIHLNAEGKRGDLQKKLTKALEKFADHPQGQVINILTLRSLSQAKYSTENVGHFGLGFEHYTHFTSPIRRYPDLIVHRLIKSQILNSPQYQAYPGDELTTAATMLSGCEQRATRCERQFYSIKKARFMEKFIGKDFQGLISSVTKFGIFVLLREYDIDGLVKLENLGNDKWVFDEDNLKLVGHRSKQVFSLGMWISVKVTHVDVEAGQIDFNLNKEEPSTPYRDSKVRSEPIKNQDSKGSYNRKESPAPHKKSKGFSFKKKPSAPTATIKEKGSFFRKSKDSKVEVAKFSPKEKDFQNMPNKPNGGTSPPVEQKKSRSLSDFLDAYISKKSKSSEKPSAPDQKGGTEKGKPVDKKKSFKKTRRR